MSERSCRLFVYGVQREGEPRHALLAGAPLIALTTTVPAFQLVDLGPYAALVRNGTTAVWGELYGVDLQVRRALDVEHQVPILFSRETIQLADGSDAEAFLLSSDQSRGRRRLAHGDWKKRFARNIPAGAGGAWVAWSRGRWTR